MNILQKMLTYLVRGAAKEITDKHATEYEAEAQIRRENTLRSLQPKMDLPDEKTEPVAAAAEKTETVTKKAETESPDDIQYEAPTILRPVQFTAEPQKIPAVHLSSSEAVEFGYSFRKSAKSVKITGFHGKAPKQLIIPCSIASLPVEEICSEVFKRAELDEVYIPGTVRKLGSGSFEGSSITKVVFGDGLSSVSDKSFSSCKDLNEVMLPLTLRHIGKSAFSYCYSLKYIGFPKNISQIEEGAFYSAGLESFGVETEKNYISNATAFFMTPMFRNYDIVSTSLPGNELKVLHASYFKPLKITAHKAEFLPYSILGGQLDLTECKQIIFSRMAVPRKRDNTYSTKTTLKLPDEYRMYTLPFLPDNTELLDSKGERIDNKQFNIERICYDDDDADDDDFKNVADDNLIYNCIPTHIPQYGLRTERKKIQVSNVWDICENAIDSETIEELKLDYFKPEGRIFTNKCINIRKVSWRNGKDTVTKYLPPAKLMNKYLKIALLNAFSTCSAPYGRSDPPWSPGYKRTVFNREVIDSIFRERKICARDNPYLKRAVPPWSDIDKTFTVSNRFKALVAVDVLRSDKMPHEPDTKIYSDFLRNHSGFCYKYFSRISEEFPEYLLALKEIISK